MAQLKKSNKVSWASGANLCQVKVFLSEDCPSKVGIEFKSCPQVKPSQRLHVMGVLKGKLSSLKQRHGVESFKRELAQIPQIKWKCPPIFFLDDNWHIAAGEESGEIITQKHREMSVFEAVYPHVSAIPPSPFIPSNVEDFQCDDSHIPAIPLTPIEDGDAAADLPDMVAPLNTGAVSQELDLPQDLSSNNLSAPHCNNPTSLNLPGNEESASGFLPPLKGDMLAAAAAMTAIREGNTQGSLIDTGLLVKFLSNPELVKQLINEPGRLANSRSEHLYGIKPETSTCPLPGMIAEQVIKKSIDETCAPANNMPKLLDSKPVTPSHPYVSLTSSMPEVIMNLNNELGQVEKQIDVPCPVSEEMAILVPSPSSKPGTAEKSVKRAAPLNAGISHNEHGAPLNAGIPYVSGLKPLTLPPPLPSSQPDILKIKRMINEYGAHDNNGIEPMSGSKQMSSSVSFSSPLHDLDSLPRMDGQYKPPSSHMKPFFSNSLPASPLSGMTAPVFKDVNYYKSLIKQHGERHGENLKISEFGRPRNYLGVSELALSGKPTELKQNHHKLCAYFNTVKGCRNGLKCPYQHDKSNASRLRTGGVLEAPRAKRVKLGFDISGRAF